MEKIQHSKFIAVLVSVIITLFASCQSDDELNLVDDGVLRVLTNTINEENFVEGIENVRTNLEIEIIFSHSLKTEMLASALSVTSALGPIDYSLEFLNDNSTIILKSNQELNYSTEYKVEIPSGSYGSNGETIEDPVSLSFTTEDFVPPAVKLSSNVGELKENSETAVITATLDKTTSEEVIVILAFNGTSTIDTDYSVTSESMVIAPGSLSASTSLTTKLDEENDDNETIIITIASVENANEDGDQELNLRIKQELSPLSLKGILALSWDGSGTNDGKAVHVVANEDIEDLSLYGLGVANNGGGTDGVEYNFPAIAISAGDDVLVARNPAALLAYFGSCSSEFEHVLEANSSISQNGDDAIELFSGDNRIETYGEADLDGTGEVWEYTGSWAYKVDRTWTYGGLGCSAGSTTTQASDCLYPICKEALELKGVMALSWEGSGTNGGKAIHLKANKDIPDLSIYGVGIANNGGGTDGVEYVFPAISVSEGDDILLAREQTTLAAYFGGCIDSFEHVFESNNAVSQNGDDAIELFKNEAVIETYGDADVDGTGFPWEYTGSWAFKTNGAWTTGALDCAAGSTTTQNSNCTYPQCG